MKIAVLALQGVFDTGLAAVLDAFTTANELAAMESLSTRFDVGIVGVRSRVQTSQGLGVPVGAIDTKSRPDWVVIPAPDYKTPDPLQEGLQRRDIRDAGDALRAWHARGVKISAACVGTFVLAESGLLEDHEATTTWWLAPLFRQRYPSVRLDASRMIVPSGRFLTAGAALSHVDMCLWLIRQSSPELAELTAHYLVTDSRPSQSAYAISDHLAHSDPLVTRFEHWVRERLATGFQLDEAVRALATSQRTLTRRINQVLGKTPLSFVQDLRVERAVHLLKTTGDSVDDVAAAVGYGDGVTLRALLRKRLGRGVRDIRN